MFGPGYSQDSHFSQFATEVSKDKNNFLRITILDWRAVRKVCASIIICIYEKHFIFKLIIYFYLYIKWRYWSLVSIIDHSFKIKFSVHLFIWVIISLYQLLKFFGSVPLAKLPCKYLQYD